MPVAQHAFVLKSVYERASELIKQRHPIVPTELIANQRTIYRTFDQEYVRIDTNGDFDPRYAGEALVIRDENTDRNRFSGQSLNASIPASGGLYCSTQQQAQINELSHSARSEPVNPEMVKALAPAKYVPRNPKTGYANLSAALNRKCIVRIRLLAPILAADISVHNAGARKFLEAIGTAPDVQHALRLANQPDRPFADHVAHSTDCSAARGIGLAVANSGYLQALQTTTVRTSERSPEELGDNLIFFGHNGEKIQGLRVEQAYLFPLGGKPIVYKF